ncbi:MAG TPA: AAA family ATPase [Actinomycetota bacterium]
MPKMRAVLTCRDCNQQVAQWVGRCPSCGAWGTIEQRTARVAARTGSHDGPPAAALVGGEIANDDARVPTGFPGVDRVLGGGLVPASVALLAGEPGIGKSTLLLHVVAHLASQGRRCLLVSGEESHAQVASRARRLGIANDAVRFAPGRDLEQVVQVALGERPFLLAVDSIQTIRDTSATQVPGGVSQVRACADALSGLAKAEGIAVLLTGHVTKDGELAGPRSLEHAVDAVLTFDGDVRSGLRVLAGGKNRFGPEGETAWFEMRPDGLREIDPTGLLVSGEHVPGAATALVQSGRRALAVEVQALVGSSEGPARRQATGLDARRFQLVAAVLDRVAGLSLGRAELFGASSGGVRIDDPACDLAIAAAMASAATGAAPPRDAAFVGEVSLTGLVRAAPAMAQRLAAARAAGVTRVFAPAGHDAVAGVEVHAVRHLVEALPWIATAHDPVTSGHRRRSA